MTTPQSHIKIELYVGQYSELEVGRYIFDEIPIVSRGINSIRGANKQSIQLLDYQVLRGLTI